MITSKNTSINKTKVPSLFTLVDKAFGWTSGLINLDIGGGKFDTASEYLLGRGVMNLIYDPFNRSVEHNQNILGLLKKCKVPTATLSNVLNVVKEKEDRLNLLRFSFTSLAVGGKLYITCYNSGKKGVSKADCWQNAEPLSFYMEEVEQVFGNVSQKGNIIYTTKNKGVMYG